MSIDQFTIMMVSLVNDISEVSHNFFISQKNNVCQVACKCCPRIHEHFVVKIVNFVFLYFPEFATDSYEI